MENTKNKGRLQISSHLLLEALHLPTDTEIHGARYRGLPDYGTIELFITHPDLPATDPALVLNVEGRFRRQPEIVFEGWNVAVTSPAPFEVLDTKPDPAA